MSRHIRFTALLLVLVLAAGGAFAEGAQAKSAFPAYALSFLLGFGTGQYYLGENGTPFLIGDAVGLGLEVGGLIYEVVSAASVTSDSASYESAVTGVYVGYGIVLVGGIVYMVSHVWEILDVFSAVDRARQAGTVAAVSPIIDVTTTAYEPGIATVMSCEVGLSFKY